MTQSTEQERAEFLKANIRGPFNEALNHREQGIAFAAWQAARRMQEVPNGWKLVPVEPTEKMVNEGGCAQTFQHGHRYIGEYAAKAAWRFMLAAAPQPPENGFL